MQWRQIADDVALMQFPLRGFGIDFGRNVTLLRLRDGRVVIHSSAPFSSEDVATIRHFGEPSWLVDATLMHDTFAHQGRAAFEKIPYFAPAGFAKVSGVATEPLDSPPAKWAGEIDVLQIGGLRRINEYAFFHRASRTLILADLLFHFPADSQGWPRFFIRHAMRLPELIGMSAFYRLAIRDKEAFEGSMKTLLELDFRQIVLAHREPIEKEAKAVLGQALSAWGFSARS